MSTPPPSAVASVSPWSAWVSTVILMVLFALAYLDRQIVSLIVAPLRAEFGVGDFQIGLLQGFAFAVLFAIAGLPLGQAVDRYSRRAIIFWGVLVWSLATMAGALTSTFGQLMAARVLVGAGEAALAPAAYSLLAQLFPREKLTFAIAVFMVGALFGAEGSLALGGYILERFSDGVTVPGVGYLSNWRFALLLVGAPGIPLAFLAWAICEPARPQTGASSQGWAPVFAFMRQHWRFFTAHTLGFALVMALVYARFAWNPSFLMRTFGWSVDQVGYALSIFGFSTGLISLLASGRIIDWLQGRGMIDAHFRFYAFGGLVLALAGTASYLSPTPWLYFAAAVPQAIFLAMGAIAASALQLVTPPELRGRVSAIYLLLVGIVGMSAGPAVVGFVTDELLGDPDRLREAMALLFGVTGLLVSAIFYLGLKPMRMAIERSAGKG